MTQNFLQTYINLCGNIYICFNKGNWLYRFYFLTTYLNISIEIFKYEMLRVKHLFLKSLENWEHRNIWNIDLAVEIAFNDNTKNVSKKECLPKIPK